MSDYENAEWLLLHSLRTSQHGSLVLPLLERYGLGTYTGTDRAGEVLLAFSGLTMREAVVALSVDLDRPAVFAAWKPGAMVFCFGERFVTFSRQADGA